MKKVVLTLAAILTLIVIGLLVIRFQSASVPARYRGIALPTPASAGDTQLPPIWLIIQDKAISGTLQSSHLSNGQGVEPNVDALWQAGELATITFPAQEQIVIVGTKVITGIQAKIVDEAPLGSGSKSLRVDGKLEGDTAVFTLEPFGYSDHEFLRVTLHFTEGNSSGIATYIWQLIPMTGSGSSSPTPASSTGPLPPCDVLPAPASTPPVLPTAHPDLMIRSPEEMTREADLIILGTVVDPSIGHFDPPLGNSETWAFPDIVTDTATQVECVLKGFTHQATIMVRTEGAVLEKHVLGLAVALTFSWVSERSCFSCIRGWTT